MTIRRTILLAAFSVAVTFTPISAWATSSHDCHKLLIRYCISMFAIWDVPPALAGCMDAMEPGPGLVPAWYPLRGEIAGGTIPPLARYRQCLAKTAAAIPHPTP